MSEKPEHTEIPWRHHDMETATLCGPDHGAVADFGAKGRSVEENQGNANLALESVNNAPARQAEIDGLRWMIDQAKDAPTLESAQTILVDALDGVLDATNVTEVRGERATLSAQVERLWGAVEGVMPYVESAAKPKSFREDNYTRTVTDKGAVSALNTLRAALAEIEKESQ